MSCTPSGSPWFQSLDGMVSSRNWKLMVTGQRRSGRWNDSGVVYLAGLLLFRRPIDSQHRSMTSSSLSIRKSNTCGRGHFHWSLSFFSSPAISHSSISLSHSQVISLFCVRRMLEWKLLSQLIWVISHRHIYAVFFGGHEDVGISSGQYIGVSSHSCLAIRVLCDWAQHRRWSVYLTPDSVSFWRFAMHSCHPNLCGLGAEQTNPRLPCSIVSSYYWLDSNPYGSVHPLRTLWFYLLSN
jgi:hypothetical protein